LSKLASYVSRLSLILLIATGEIIAVPLLQSSAALPGVSAALADDDDGDDGDDDDDDGGGSASGGRSSGGDDDDDGPRGDLRSLFRWPFQREERRPQRRTVSIPDRAPNEIVAVGLSEASIAGLTQDGFVVDERIPITLTNSELVRLTIPRGMTLDAARQAVADAAPSASVDFNHYYQPEEQDSAICTGRGCDLVRHIVGWPTQSGEPSCNASLPIGLIDTAINEKHPSLADAKIEVVRLGDQEVPQSGAQHGTAVAALLVGTTGSRAPGLIPAAQLVAVDAFQRYRKTADIANVYDLVRALDLLSSRGIRIINLSLSGPGNLLLEQAVRAATERGTILIAAAGNEGPNAKPVFPAAYPDVIAVTAVDKQMKAYRRAVRGGHIDIAAPGVGVWTAASISGARHKSGTSFAAPFVTAAASVLLAANTDMTASALEEELMRSASDIGEPGKDNVFGWGLLNARALCQG
jgi:subtilisin family serine protease